MRVFAELFSKSEKGGTNLNYLIWKGRDSRDIKGLLISELPPISKPAMKTQMTEIEGMDGDFSDDIGYAPYDKSVTIGLYGGYNADEILKFFSGAGKVTFSNEPDKYYNSKISEQIDLERLVKFRIGTIKFHTQPFKYLVDEKSVELDIESQKELKVKNLGLESSKPIVTLTGSGIIEISVNGLAQFQVNIENSELTIDSMLEECYENTVSVLKNRNMGGEFPTLNPGENIITWTGNLTKIKVHPMSRWL